MIEDSLYKYANIYKSSPDWIKKILSLPLVFKDRQKYFGKNYQYYLKLIKSSEFLPESQIAEYQFSIIKNLLNECYNYVPYYKRIWDEQGIDIKKIKDINDFSSMIPVLNREIVRNNFSELISRKYKTNYRLEMNTGGSTGNPLRLIYLKGLSRVAEWAHIHSLWERVGYKANSKMATLRGEYIGRKRIYSYDPWRRQLTLSSFNITESNAIKYLELLDKYKIEFINAYPSSLINLVNCSQLNNYSLRHLKGILLGSENIYDYQIKQFKSFFRIESVYYWYGQGEQVSLGGLCEHANDYHFCPTYSYTEFEKKINNQTDTDNGDCNYDVHEIIGTSFINPIMPLIRYKTGDLCSPPIYGTCKCGRNHSRIKRVFGREQEMAIGKNGERITLTALIFGRHLTYLNHIYAFQIDNTIKGELVFNVIPKTSFNAHTKNEIMESLSKKNGMPFSVKVNAVKELVKNKNGKVKLLIRNN